MLRRLSALAALALALTFGAGAPASADHHVESSDRFPARLQLPRGFQPEGIAIGRGPTAWVGSLADGDIYRLDLRTGAGKVVVQGPGKPAVGMKVARNGLLVVAGGTAGDARLVDPRAGKQVDSRVLTTAGPFINDVVLTDHAAWFTDSNHPTLYRVPLGSHGFGDAKAVPLTGEWTQTPKQFNANGITETPDGDALLVVNTYAGALFRVDPDTGRATKVDLGGEKFPGGDGMLLLGRTLYISRSLPGNMVEEFRLNRSGTRGELVRRITDPGFDTPSTIARFGDGLYLPSARFSTPPGPTVEYWVTRIER
ncbi:SMP-30/gluconolactonase/LRE family protein [Georgenia thermotolerans]|uniref:Superoxide dismutase n=1 Tax=Georgenia thermotolerans TaxID=527326 RepID=A0A7J5UTD4_9MICO|nr:superoxide dismutase [Georgenia thermotolerans]KAE8765536.1 superoxide dismutase [Georgenia thermotolerans]